MLGGDGEKGDDVTDNVKTIRTIPLVLHGNYPKSFEIRGAIMMPVSYTHLNRKTLEVRLVIRYGISPRIALTLLYGKTRNHM